MAGERGRAAGMVLSTTVLFGLALSSAYGGRVIVAPQNSDGADARSVWSGVFTDAQAERGSILYLRSCAGCHKPDLTGDSAEEIPGLVGDALRETWDNETLGSLFERVSTGMPANKPGTLTAVEYADLLAYLLRANGFPAGRDELRPDVDALRRVVLAWAPSTTTVPARGVDF